MKKILTTILLIGFFTIFYCDSYSQDRKFGIKGGGSAYSLSTQFGNVEATTDRKIGFEAGIFGDFPVSRIFSIQAEAVFVQKGGEENDEAFGISSATLNYIDVPLLLKIKIPTDGSIKPFIFGGGYAGYLLEATSDQEGSSQDITEFVEDLNYGLKFGLGTYIGNFLIDARYDMGLANLFGGAEDLPDQADDFKVTTSGIVLTIGISF